MKNKIFKLLLLIVFLNSSIVKAQTQAAAELLLLQPIKNIPRVIVKIKC